MAELFKNFCLFVNLLNQVGWLVRFTDVDCFYGNHFLCFLMCSSPHFAETSLPQQFVNFVLVNNLAHVEGPRLGLNVDFISVLDKTDVIFLEHQAHQVVKATFFWKFDFHLFTQNTKQTLKAFHVFEIYFNFDELSVTVVDFYLKLRLVTMWLTYRTIHFSREPH